MITFNCTSASSVIFNKDFEQNDIQEMIATPPHICPGCNQVTNYFIFYFVVQAWIMLKIYTSLRIYININLIKENKFTSHYMTYSIYKPNIPYKPFTNYHL